MTGERRENNVPGRAPEKHDERVRTAFDDLHESLGERATPEARESVEKLREAALGRDGARVRTLLEEVRERHGWLYEELARHPKLADLINELALMGL
jgi:hypothetical protein